ncbi:hypothetical protein BY996DRAFT_1911547 [Phakopsora pachyrhizi]|uniref:Expressed protein n=1 Tax=Phakopsora pachyrhizi TaxID=170000 RepID=A0AAV0AXE6_PHAPC|nr:hypothetical protein BY996DRAFT_1911547 [Phakopsora pachyrhizi]CAH7673253.1 expressed protein [Phakopsora pachyrhizi]
MLLNKNFRIIFEVSIFLMRFVSCKNKGYKDIPNGRSNVVVSRMARVEAVVPTLEQYLIDPTKDYGPAHKDNGPFRLSSSVDLKLPGIIVRDVSYEKGEDQDEVSRVKSPTNVNGRVHSGLVPPLRGSDVLQNLEASLAREAVGRDYHRVVRRASESNKYPIETPIKAKIQPIVSKLYDRSKVSKSSEKIKGVVRSTTIFSKLSLFALLNFLDI